MMTPALVWLLAQIEADERIATQASLTTDNDWHLRRTHGQPDDHTTHGDNLWGLIVAYGPEPEQTVFEGTGEHYDDGIGRDTATHIATFDPGRVLAECGAKRRQIEMLVELQQLSELLPFHTDVGLCIEQVGQALLLPYADRQGAERWMTK